MKRRGPRGLSSLEWFIVAAILAFSFAYSTKANSFGNYIAEYIENYDADSITLKVWLWPASSKNTGQYAIENMRLYGVDTPEKGWRAKCPSEAQLAKKAEVYVRDLLTAHRYMLLDVQPTRGARGRPLVTLWVSIEGKEISVANMLIEEGYARPYFGGKRQGWCGTSITLPDGVDIGRIA